MAKMRKSGGGGKKVKRHVTEGYAHIQATFNNTIITITDRQGNVLTWSSAGSSGFKGPRKSTAYAASIAAGESGKSAVEMGMREIDVKIRGPGPGREASVSALHAKGLRILSIRDVTPIPHNGCRPSKRRRV